MKSIEYKLEFIEKCEMCGSKNYTFIGRRLNGQQRNLGNEKSGVCLNILKCDDCGLIFCNPLPIPKNIQDHYGVDPSSYWRDEYFYLDENYFKYEIDQAKKLLGGNESNMKALDIGAGIGKCIKSLSYAGFEAYGIEPSKTFYDLAIQKNSIQKENIYNIPIEELNQDIIDLQFDFITFGAVLEHLAHPKEALLKASKMLKSGGIIHVEVPYSEWLIGSLVNFSYKLKGKPFVTNLSPMHSPYHLYEFGLGSFEMAAKDIGMEVVHIDHFVCDTYLSGILSKLARGYMQKYKKGMQIGVWIRKI